MYQKILWLLGMSTFLFAGFLYAQQQPVPRNQQPEVIDIEARVINARAELPQVQILDKRKQVEFDEVKVEKKFTSELSGKTEKVKFVSPKKDEISPIKNIDVLLNKKRF